MPIQVACRCGQKFAAKEELAGKRVKCPACGEALQIPVPHSGGKPAEKQQLAAPIAVACKCGQKFSAKPELAGKTVKCPACGGSLLISAPGGQKQAPPPEMEMLDDLFPGGGISDLLDEVGLTATQTGHRCPSCQAEIAADAVICIQCGYHKELGKKLESKRFKEE